MSRNSILHETDAIDRLSGLAQLQQAITAEHSRGPGHLHRVYNRYFRHPTLPALLVSSVVAQKEWFLVIRSAREAIDLFAYDAFAISPSLRAWIGLPPPPRGVTSSHISNFYKRPLFSSFRHYRCLERPIKD
jgi:hypothetical protein